MSIFKWEIKSNFKTFFIWSVVFIILIVMMITEFSAYYNNPEINDLLSMMPEAMLKAFSMDQANLTTPTGYLSIIILYLYLMGGIYAALLGTNIIAKEERDKTSEFLMSKPVSRYNVLTQKLIAAILYLIGLTMVVNLTVVMAFQPYALESDFYAFIWLVAVAMLLILMIFFSLGFLLASFVKRYKLSSKIATSSILIFYFISILSALSEKVDFLRHFTPFKFFEALELANKGTLHTGKVALSAGIILAALGLSFIIYPKRDLSH